MNLVAAAQKAMDTIAQLDARNGQLANEHAAAIKAKDDRIAALEAQVAERDAYRTEMESKVAAVLSSGDPAQYEALAAEFLTPAQEKERQEKLAALAELEAQANALKTELGV